MKSWDIYDAVFEEQFIYFPVRYIRKEGFLIQNANQDS